MRTDLKLNYHVLELISGKLSRCYTAIENMQVELYNLEKLLSEQDSQAFATEVTKIQSTVIYFGKKNNNKNAL